MIYDARYSNPRAYYRDIAVIRFGIVDSLRSQVKMTLWPSLDMHSLQPIPTVHAILSASY